MKSEEGSTERLEKLAKVFKKAIKMEQKAQGMYHKALATCDDKDLKDILVGLREDEVRHEKELTDLYEDMKAIMKLQELPARKRRPKEAEKATAKPTKRSAR